MSDNTGLVERLSQTAPALAIMVAGFCGRRDRARDQQDRAKGGKAAYDREIAEWQEHIETLCAAQQAIRAAIAALQSSEARALTAEAWRPIGTAPRDGTRVDLWMVDETGKGWREPDAYWVVQRPVNPYASVAGLRDGWFGPNHDYDGAVGWADTPEWFSKGDNITRYDKATHWRPTPEPPRSEEGGQP